MDMQCATNIRPGWEIVEHDEGRLQLVFIDHTATFTSPPVVRAVKALVAELQTDTRQSIAADVVSRAAETAGLSVGLVAHVLELLDGSHCLYTPSPDDSRDPVDWFFAAAGDAPVQMRDRLARTEIALLSSERSAALLMQAASASCLSVRPIEVVAGDLVADVLRRLTAARDAGAGLIAVFDLPTHGALASRVNAFAIAHSLPSLYGDCRTALAQLGPYVLPGSGGCLECLNLRKLSNSNEAEQAAFGNRRQRMESVVCDPQPAHPAFLAAIANLFVCELADIIAAKPSRLLSSFIEMPMSGLLPSQHSYLRLPRCPCCGTKSPARYAWNATFVSPEVKNEHNGS